MNKSAAFGSLLPLLVLAACRRPATPLPSAPDSIHISSTTFPNLGAMPLRSTADGGNVSPELAWTAPPPGTKSLALVMEDPDAPGGDPFVHWLVYAIHPSLRSIAEGQTPPAALSGKNDTGRSGYFGPKPPSGTHRYVFHIYALDQELSIEPGVKKADLIKSMEGHAIARGELIGICSAPKL